MITGDAVLLATVEDADLVVRTGATGDSDRELWFEDRKRKLCCR